jgi:phosphoribosylanthranilate isomerase
MRTRIKICGITNPEDGRAALSAGADYIGMILTESPRRLSLEEAEALRRTLPADAQVIGVFADEPPETVEPYARALRLHAIQVSGWMEQGDDLGCEVWHVLRAARLPDPIDLPMVPLRTYLLDAHDAVLPGGTGTCADWTWAKRCVDLGRRLVVAGGLNPANIGELVREVRPFGVDASSGLEAAPRQKSSEKILSFIEQVRAADRERPKRS